MKRIPQPVLLILGALCLITGTAGVVLTLTPDSPDLPVAPDVKDNVPSVRPGPSSDAWQLAERELDAALLVATRELSEMREADEEVSEYGRQGYGLLYDRVDIGGETLKGIEATNASLYMLGRMSRRLSVMSTEGALARLRVALEEAEGVGVIGPSMEEAKDTLRHGELKVVGLKGLDD